MIAITVEGLRDAWYVIIRDHRRGAEHYIEKRFASEQEAQAAAAKVMEAARRALDGE